VWRRHDGSRKGQESENVLDGNHCCGLFSRSILERDWDDLCG
jgi:hypothetical protein